MKISFCSIAFRKESFSLEEIVPIIAEIGYDGIEIWGNHLSEDWQKLGEIKRTLDKYSLQVSMISPYFNFTGSFQEWEASLQATEKFIDYAYLLQSPLVRVFTGVAGSDQVSPELRKRCVEGLKKAAAYGELKGIILALETHPCTLTDNIHSTLQLLGEVAADNLKINLDIYHFWEIYRDPVFVLQALSPHIVHIHAKNAILSPEERRKNPHPFLHDRQAQQEFVGVTHLAEGEMEYQPFLRELVRENFSDFLSVEWFGENVQEAAHHELVYLRQQLRNLSKCLNQSFAE